LAGFLHYALNPRWQRFGQLLNDFRNNFSKKILIFSVKIFFMKILDFLYEKS